ncbi:hypothetical protein N7462_011345 [Penicillium macrosclerotiorum]|uniref:uncharacterized protein n=1 Tax=Penicillium macrosclerotiorum TaxID=303699 RepID=UPI002548257C|nr:uncharacterized protein N7462_011345 [Penicillium macrosclerotiorum]KAJ5666936.1 hypothetical protein N7462_011345 [Penicillium macrosclerotiorum]
MRLFALGSNGSGQLALGHTEDVSLPTQCLFTNPPAPVDEIVHIAAGGNHTLLLTKQGHVYGAGANLDGRCGPPSKADGLSPGSSDENLLCFRRIVLHDEVTGEAVDTFACVSATWEGSILVARSNSVHPELPSSGVNGPVDSSSGDTVFVLGSSPKGELGLALSPGQGPVVRPGSSITAFPPAGTCVAALASGMGHSVAVLSNGEVYGWGGARKGQLGDGLKGQKIVWTPIRIEGIPFPARSAVCGREFTVVCGDPGRGEFVVLGDPANRWGVLGVPEALRQGGSKGDYHGREFVDIGASWHGIYVHAGPGDTGSATEAQTAAPGTIVAWGRNDRGQLPPSGLPKPLKMAVGSEHVLVLLEDGAVGSFGWGEHGNCGPDTDAQGNVAGSYNVIPLPEAALSAGARVTRLGAGCATSWIVMK